MSKNNLYRKFISSEKLGKQIFGALIQWRKRPFWAFLLLVTPLTIGVSYILSPNNYIPCLCLIGLNLVVWLTIKVCSSLTEVFSLRKQETGITWCQISILIAIGLWIVGFILAFGIQNDSKIGVALVVIGSVIGWVFQDKVKGIVAFIHLRMHHLLNIDDWIVVPKYNVDGGVKRVSLTTVTVFNWDNTTSTFPISALYSDHFMNYQHMADGKTYGRKMSKTFILDTSWFRPLSKEEIDRLRDTINEYAQETIEEQKNDAIHDNLPMSEIEDDMLNAKLFRIYFFHWMMNHKHVSQQPRMVVRWKDHVEGGMLLEIYAFITETNLAAYEYHQSHIIEHFIEALDWFGLRLYQSPSAFDADNKIVYLSQEQPTHRKEMTDEL